MRLLVTRPQEDAERTAVALRARGHDAVIAPLLRVELMSDVELGVGPWAAVLMTSANAARAIARHPRKPDLLGLPVFVVGQRTADAAHEAGFTDVVSADGDQRDLVNLVAARSGADKPLLYLAGEDRAGDLAGDLGRQGRDVQTVVIYHAVAGALPDLVQADLLRGHLNGVLHYSQRSAEAFVSATSSAELRKATLAVAHYCLSAEVAVPLRAAGLGHIRIAARPTEASLLDVIGPA